MSLVELKAQAYDCLAQIQNLNRLLDQINAKIAEESQKAIEPKEQEEQIKEENKE